jgi:hypothetical protein
LPPRGIIGHFARRADLDQGRASATKFSGILPRTWQGYGAVSGARFREGEFSEFGDSSHCKFAGMTLG